MNFSVRSVSICGVLFRYNLIDHTAYVRSISICGVLFRPMRHSPRKSFSRLFFKIFSAETRKRGKKQIRKTGRAGQAVLCRNKNCKTRKSYRELFCRNILRGGDTLKLKLCGKIFWRTPPLWKIRTQAFFCEGFNNRSVFYPAFKCFARERFFSGKF